MSTKSKARMARRHPESTENEPNPTSLRGEQREAAGEIIGAVLTLVTLGALEESAAAE